MCSIVSVSLEWNIFFFFNDTATTEIYTLSLHDALPISGTDAPRRGARRCRPSSAQHLRRRAVHHGDGCAVPLLQYRADRRSADRKSTRLNSSHANISYAVFCLKKKKSINDRIL